MAAASLILLGCSANEPEPPTPPRVAVHTVMPVEAPVFLDLKARVRPLRTSEVRARATGIVQSRRFEEGASVAAGDLLFTIDPAPLTAALAQAQAEQDLAQAEWHKADLLYTRYKRLAPQHAISRHDYDVAKADRAAARHKVDMATAAMQAARLRLSHTEVRAPLSGRIGLAQVTEGAFVSETDATLLARIVQLDPIHIDATQSTHEAARYARAIAEGRITPVRPTDHPAFVTLDGTPYPHHGAAHAMEPAIDPLTDRFIVRATFPNPDHTLLPGMFVTLRVPQGVAHALMSVPQSSVIAGEDGKPAVVVVDSTERARRRAVQLGEMRGAQWEVLAGLLPGDRVVVHRAAALRPGELIDPYPHAAAADSLAQGST